MEVSGRGQGREVGRIRTWEAEAVAAVSPRSLFACGDGPAVADDIGPVEPFALHR